jgi:cytochrome c oxidase assembly factor CtaG
MMLTQLGTILEQTLTTRMMAHDFLFVAAGFFFAYAASFLFEAVSRSSTHFSRKLRNVVHRSNLGAKMSSILAFGSAGSLIAYWYLPGQFDAVGVKVGLNAEMYAALLLAGALILAGSRFLSKGQKTIAPVFVGKALGLYGMILLLTPGHIYIPYPVYEQVHAGVALLILMVVLDFTIMPLWLYNYFGKASTAERNSLGCSMLMD